MLQARHWQHQHGNIFCTVQRETVWHEVIRVIHHHIILGYLQTYRGMIFIVMFIHKLPRNHFSAVLALLEVTGAMYRMQVDVRRWDLPLTDEHNNKETYCEWGLTRFDKWSTGAWKTMSSNYISTMEQQVKICMNLTNNGGWLHCGMKNSWYQVNPNYGNNGKGIQVCSKTESLSHIWFILNHQMSLKRTSM